MTPAEIARSLTEAQRRAMSRPDEDWHEKWRGMISSWGDQEIADSLFRLGLIETRQTLAYPTHLGLQVRQILQEQNHAQS